MLLRWVMGFTWVALIGGGVLAVFSLGLAQTKPPTSGMQAKSAFAFVDSIGVNTHFAFAETNYGRAFPKVKARLLESGIRHIRDGSMRPENYKKGTRSTAMWNELASHGIRMNMIGHARWTATDILEILEANQASIIAIEGTNEPDLFLKGDWRTQARDFQALLWQTVKGSSYAHLPVIAPALARPNRYGELGDLSEFADLANIHSYNGGRRPTENLEMQRQVVQQTAGKKPIVSTETGYHTAVATSNGHLPISEQGAGKYLPRLLFDYFEQGIVRTYLYQFYDHIPPSNENPEANFGLVRYDFTVRPAYVAIKNIIALLQENSPRAKLDKLDIRLTGQTKELKTALLQKNDGTFVLALWQDLPVWDRRIRGDLRNEPLPVEVALPEVMELSLYRPSSGSRPITSSTNRTIKVLVPDEVVMLTLKR
jgi:hypothetical protein